MKTARRLATFALFSTALATSALAADIQSPVSNWTGWHIGAGAGSYEPPHRTRVAIEPSQTMIRQRPPGAAPCIQATAENLPLESRSIDAALAVLTLHHWSDLERGLREMALATFVLATVAMLVLVLPTWLLDVLLAANVTLSVTPDLITRVRDNLGRTRSSGFEVDASFRITPDLALIVKTSEDHQTTVVQLPEEQDLI